MADVINLLLHKIHKTFGKSFKSAPMGDRA